MASSPQHEPTMEEILASIRKIISEDASEAPPPATPMAAPADADVLELTQEVHEEPAPAPMVIAASAPEPAQTAAAPEADHDVVFQSIEEVAVSSEAKAATSAHEGIFSDKTRKALEDSFASIEPPQPEPVAPPPAASVPVPPIDSASVQAAFEKAVRETFDPVLHQWLGDNSETVVERMKPLIRAWLDEHFPALLEGAVRAEVERVARARH